MKKISKEEARRKMKQLRNEMAQIEKKEKDKMILQNLFQMDAFQNAEWFFSFVSYRSEVDTISMIQKVLSEKKMKVAVPKVFGNEMSFYEITSMDDLKSGYQGILEPVTDRLIEIQDGIILLPGLAFDLSKNRVGYGGGFYDRYLEKQKNMIKIAVAYDFQILPEIENGDFDIKPDWIVTEKRIF